jgi:hypothetical protein
MTFGRLTVGGGLVSLNGTLKVTTIGSPPPGSPWPIISSANVFSQFASVDFGPLNYSVPYSATAVTLYGLAPCDYWIGGNGNFNAPSIDARRALVEAALEPTVALYGKRRMPLGHPDPNDQVWYPRFTRLR